MDGVAVDADARPAVDVATVELRSDSVASAGWGSAAVTDATELAATDGLVVADAELASAGAGKAAG